MNQQESLDLYDLRKGCDQSLAYGQGIVQVKSSYQEKVYHSKLKDDFIYQIYQLIYSHNYMPNQLI